MSWQGFWWKATTRGPRPPRHASLAQHARHATHPGAVHLAAASDRSSHGMQPHGFSATGLAGSPAGGHASHAAPPCPALACSHPPHAAAALLPWLLPACRSGCGGLLRRCACCPPASRCATRPAASTSTSQRCACPSAVPQQLPLGADIDVHCCPAFLASTLTAHHS